MAEMFQYLWLFLALFKCSGKECSQTGEGESQPGSG